MTVIRFFAYYIGISVAVGTLSAGPKWTKVTGPHFTFLTSSSVSQAKEWAACLEAYQTSLNGLAPFDERLLDEMTIVVFDRERDYRAVVEPYGRPRADQIPIFRYGNQYGRFIGAVNPDSEDAAQHGVFMMAGFWLTNSYRVQLPLWLATGLQEVYAKNYVSNKAMTIGYTDAGIRRSFAVDGMRLLSLERLMGMTTNSDTYQNRAGAYNLQAWAVVHYLLIGDNGANLPRLQKYMAAIQRGAAELEARQEAFPEGLDVLEQQVKRYARSGRYATLDLPLSMSAFKNMIRVEPATDAEVLQALGYLTLIIPDAAPAEPYYDQLRTMAPNAPDTLEGLAILAARTGDTEQMYSRFRAAVEAGSTNYVAHYYALQTGVQLLYGRESAADRCPPELARKMVDATEEVLRLRPNFLPAYETLGALIGALAEVNDGDATILAAGLRRYPDNAMLQCGQLAYDIQRHRFADAKARLARLRSGEFPGIKENVYYLNRLIARLGAVINLKVLEQRLKAGDLEEAAEVMQLLNRAPLRQDEYTRLVGMRGEFARRSMLDKVRHAIGIKDWPGAAAMLKSLELMEPPEETKSEIAVLRSQIKAAQP